MILNTLTLNTLTSNTLTQAPMERRIMAIVLPELLDELALQRVSQAVISRAGVSGVATAPRPSLQQAGALCWQPAPPKRSEVPEARGAGSTRSMAPRAVVLVEFDGQVLEPNARLDAVNDAARRRGVFPRRTIAQATAVVENLVVHALPLGCVTQSLKQVAEAALSFGSPVAFEAPDTVWVDVTGTRHLFGGERELGEALAAHVRALGHTVRVAGAPGPWLARAFARHADFDETGVFLVNAKDAARQAGFLPISALPISSEAVAWFSRLGLLSLEDLRKLPSTALAARLESPGLERTLDLIQGRDDGVLAAHLPEELPLEEQSWDCPLESVEPLLFVLKGLAARLASRLEGRGQAARELLLSIQYDRAIVALRNRNHEREHAAAGSGVGASNVGGDRASEAATLAAFSKELPFRLATPLSHADDLERIVRARLQRETLLAPARGLRLQVTGITEARQIQLGLDTDTGLGSTLSADPRAMEVLVAELSADIGGGSVGLLETLDSYLPEKSSRFVPMENVPAGTGSCHPTAFELPTRLITPIEIEAPLREREMVVLGQSAYVIQSITFEQRLESVEWWAESPVSRDYFRLWLSSLSPASISPAGVSSSAAPSRDGLSVLVFSNRDDGKKYVQAVYD